MATGCHGLCPACECEPSPGAGSYSCQGNTGDCPSGIFRMLNSANARRPRVPGPLAQPREGAQCSVLRPHGC